jgi:cellulose synthase/poly-beta-1,6-N-acetylglucosamine synthase-like glycosyltransferase
MELRGKHYAIGWALEQLPWQDYEAIIVIDADTIVEPDYATQLSRWPDLGDRAIQTYDHLSNETENALTRLAGLLGRIRYEISLPLKARAGLSVPMTGDGIALGREILRRHPWRVRTITEGWELYARLTLAGVTLSYEPRSKLYAQEARSLDQSRTQRERWTAGRLDVLRLHWHEILASPGVPVLQRLDLLAELLSLGPVIRGMLGGAGVLASFAIDSPYALVAAVLFATGFLQPILYSLLVLRQHPERSATLLALLYLPRYALWRLAVGARGLLSVQRNADWTRTKRKPEAQSRVSQAGREPYSRGTPDK